MVRDPVVPAAQRPAGGVLHHSLLVVLASEAADSIYAGEERDRGELDLIASILAQQARAAEAADAPQVRADLGFVVTLIVLSRDPWCPSVPDSRDHLLLTPLIRPSRTNITRSGSRYLTQSQAP